MPKNVKVVPKLMWYCFFMVRMRVPVHPNPCLPFSLYVISGSWSIRSGCYRCLLECSLVPKETKLFCKNNKAFFFQPHNSHCSGKLPPLTIKNLQQISSLESCMVSLVLTCFYSLNDQFSPWQIPLRGRNSIPTQHSFWQTKQATSFRLLLQMKLSFLRYWFP